VQPPLGGFDPGFEPITFPVFDPDQDNPCRLHKQNAQVAIAAPQNPFYRARLRTLYHRQN
jgi:hypothetical protein